MELHISYFSTSNNYSLICKSVNQSFRRYWGVNLLFLYLHTQHVLTHDKYLHTQHVLTHTTCTYTHNMYLHTQHLLTHTHVLTHTTYTYTHNTYLHTQHVLTHTRCIYTHNMYLHIQHVLTHTTCTYTHNTYLHTQHILTHTTCTYTHKMYLHTQHVLTHSQPLPSCITITHQMSHYCITPQTRVLLYLCFYLQSAAEQSVWGSAGGTQGPVWR